MPTFGKHRFKPSGEWVQTTMVEKVAGIQFKKDDAISFCKSVRKAEAKDDSYGVLLLPDPTNKHVKYAIEVHGFAAVSGFFGRKVKNWHIGYLPAETAKELHTDLVAKDIPMAGELYEIYQSDRDFIDVKVIVLAPPGNSHKARTSRR